MVSAAVDRHAGPVGSEFLQHTCLAVQQPLYMAFAHTHFVCQVLDDLVMDQRNFQLRGDLFGDLDAERAHFPGDGNQWHGFPPRVRDACTHRRIDGAV